MTQPPPPPPHQPPQGGGFGPPADQPQQPQPAQAPQPPAQAPHTPQPPPGYGYPQAGPPPQPPQPPQQPAGYGYPAQPPNPYAQQQPGAYPQPNNPYGAAPPNPYGAQQPPPGYGYPQATVPMQAQAGGGSGGKKINAQVAIIVSAVVAIALIVGGGVWYASSDDGAKDDTATSGDKNGGDKDKNGGDGAQGDEGAAPKGSERVPADTAAGVLFQIPAPPVKDEQIHSVAGSWLTDSVYAKSGVNQVTGYDPDTGGTKWTLPLTGQTCGYARQITGDGTTVVLSEAAKRNAKGEHEPCTQITAFNVDSGKKLWSKSVTVSDAEVAFAEATISGGTVAVGGGYSGGAAFDVTTGKVLWQPKVSNCTDVGYAGGARLVAVHKCGDYGNEKYEVQLIDPKTGSVKWGYKVPDGLENIKVISTQPVVFGVDSADITASGASDVFSLDDSGKLLYKIPLEDGEYNHRCEIARTDGCGGIVVGNGKLYVPTKEHDGGADSRMTNEIVAFSLETGKSTGDRIDAGDRYTVFPLRMDGGDLVAYKEGPYDKGDQIVSVNGGSLKQTTLLETPGTRDVRDAISRMVPRSAEALYTDGRLFLGKNLVSKPYTKGEEVYTALGFGAK
ncbi:PQQ-binding-like beta-propeller repeat protein [Streptomyces sp. NPDC088789]|uniref:outer membrane protein assembly factor BamB family protein n=1 Tax=Streptomyces sp. NPDC088789 TaxID=3365899 RepID=UPI00380D60B4